MSRFLFLMILLANMAPVGVHAAKVEIGDTPPNFLGRDPDNEEIQLDEMQGKVVVITFWATWCAPCLAELPVLEAIQRQAGPDRLRVIAINFRQGKKVYRSIIKRLSDYQLTFAYDRKGRVSGRYGVKSLPHMFMIDRQGRVAQVHLGYGEGMIDRMIDELNELLLDE